MSRYAWTKNYSTGTHHTIVGPINGERVKVTRLEGGGYYWAEYLAGGPWDDTRGEGASVKAAVFGLVKQSSD